MRDDSVGGFILDAEAGVLDMAEVIAWADRVIENSESPPIDVIDLSLMGNAPVEDVESMLRRSYEGVFNLQMIARSLLKIVEIALKTGNHDAANQRCWKILMQDKVVLPPDIRGLLYQYDDRYDYYGEALIPVAEINGVLQQIKVWAQIHIVAA